jgi:hypothetical protein
LHASAWLCLVHHLEPKGLRCLIPRTSCQYFSKSRSASASRVYHLQGRMSCLHTLSMPCVPQRRAHSSGWQRVAL